MAVLTSPWVFIDLETTGLKPETDKIIEFGLVRYGNDGNRATWGQLVNPGQAMDPFITQLTGIDDAMLSEAPMLSTIRDEAIPLIEGSVVVAHNAAFDVTFLQQQLGIAIQPSHVVDTIELAKILHPALRSYSLRNLARAFGVEEAPNHRAEDDAVALEQLFFRLAAKAYSLPRALMREIAEILGGEERGLGGFFTGLLLNQQPVWLTDGVQSLPHVLQGQANAGEGAGVSAATGAGVDAGTGAGAGVSTGAGASNPAPWDAGEDSAAGVGAGAGAQEAKQDQWEQEWEQGFFDDDAELEHLFASAGVSREEERDAELARQYWSEGHMQGLLSGDGALSAMMENYQHRSQQAEMLESVVKALNDSRYLMVEAPTGVGKSLAYLIPAVCWAKAFGHKVVIATHTIALQEQLFYKEISLLKALLPFTFQGVMLKGRGNYLCLNRWRQVAEWGKELIWGERVLLARLAVWHAEGGGGDLDSLHLFGLDREWFSQMASSRETCQGNQCRYYKQCFFQRARQGAASAQVIIINHALLLSGSRLGEKVLPKFSHLIIDEAHHLEEDGTKYFTDTFSLLEYEKRLQQLHRRRDVFGRPGFIQYLKEYQQAGFSAVEVLLPHLDEMEKQLKNVMKRVNSLQAALQNSSLPETFRIKPGKPRGSHLESILVNLDNLWVISAELRATVDRLSVHFQGDGGAAFEETWLKQQLLIFEEVKNDVDLLRAFLSGINGAAAATADTGDTTIEETTEEATTEEATAEETTAEDSVYWVVRDSRRTDISLCITPLDIASCFRKYLFEGKDSVIFTSATLSVNEGFDYCSQQLGVDKELLDTRMLDSPFDHEKQVLLLTDKDLPDPSKTAESVYNLALADSLETLLGACGGRSMVLFTSHRQLRAMYNALVQPLRLMGLELFADGVNGNRSTLLDELRLNERAVVFGANTYWEGVDLPGLYLTSLLIVRLPFAPPGQPLVEARIEQLEAEGKDPFNSYSLPNAVLRFKQGYGRLIRTSEDWGVVVVLDNRIVNKGYGRVFRQSLPAGNIAGASPKQLADRISAWREAKLEGYYA